MHYIRDRSNSISNHHLKLQKGDNNGTGKDDILSMNLHKDLYHDRSTLFVAVMVNYVSEI